MPHSTSHSTDTVQTFDLGIDDESQTVVEVVDETRPMSAHSKSSSAYGVAVTSTPSRDERKELPSQRNSIISNRRKSAPNSHTYADVMEQGGPVQEGPILRSGALKENRRSASYNEESKRRSQHYEEPFNYKNGALGHTKEKVPTQSPVVAELKTNVIIKDEFTLVTDLTRHLAKRYQRPESCIMIKVDHSACLALGGNFDPCYILHVQALPSQMGASTNKRNAALIQSFMADILSVPSERGIVTFVPVLEENVAQNGRTVFDIMGKAERDEVRKVAEATRKSMTYGKNSNPMLNGHSGSNSNLFTGSESSKSATPEPSITPNVNGTSGLRDRASSANSKTGRPSTAHGTFDGLRMNPVTADAVSESGRTPNGRPKTIGVAEPAASVQEELKREPLPQASKSASTQSVPLVSQATTGQSAPQTQPRATKSDPKKTSTTAPTKSILAPQAPRPVQSVPKSTTTSTVTAPVTSPAPTRPKHTPLIPETRQKNTYLDNVSALSSKGADPPSPTIVVTSSDDIPLKANTAKRRSTITATPKLPHHPPPPAEPIDTKSMSSRLSKRKSFLRMFKRNSIPAWYEQ